MAGWLDGLQSYVLLISTSVISGQWEGDNDRLCAMEPCLQFENLPKALNLELVDQIRRPALKHLS